MAESIITGKINVGFIADGGTLDIPIGTLSIPMADNNVKVTLSPPAGMTYSSSLLGGIGTYNDVTKIWDIGAVPANTELSAVFKYEVTNSCLFNDSAQFTYVLSTDCEACIDNNTVCLVIDGVTCCEVVSCVVDEEVIDEFNNLSVGNTVTLTSNLNPAKKLVVHRNGVLLNTTQYSVSNGVLTFVVPFGASGGATASESVQLEYYSL